MKEYGINILYGILAVGIIISIYHIATDRNGAGLGNVIDTLVNTSLVLLASTIIYLLFSFKRNIRKGSVWFLLLLSCPLSIMSMTQIFAEYSLKMTETTTPKEFLYKVKVDPSIYERDKIKIQKLVDSLIDIQKVEKPAELASRYFDGETYNDTIERDWAIDLPAKLEYKETVIDTLFYSETGKEIIAGLLINKVYNEYQDYPKGGIEFIGNGFFLSKNDFKPIEILKYSVGGYANYQSCSDRLRYYYLKKIGTFENEFNMDDVRFLNQKK